MPVDHDLHKLAYKGDIENFESVFRYSGVDVNLAGSQGRTFLHRACVSNKVEMVQLLISNYSANVNALDQNGNSPLFFAALGGSVASATILLANGADINLKNLNGQTAVFYSAEKGQVEFTSFMIENKVNLSIRDSKGKTAYDVAQANYKRSLDKKKLFKQNMKMLKPRGAYPIPCCS